MSQSPSAGASSSRADHPNCLAVDAALSAAGMPGRVRILDEPAPTAAAAAAALGVPVGAICNSLVFALDGGDPDDVVLVLASGAHRVDTALAAVALGVSALKRATPEAVRAATGQPIGGVAPVGHPAALRTLIDIDLAGYDEVWAAGGIPHAIFPTTLDQLAMLTGGVPARIA